MVGGGGVEEGIFYFIVVVEGYVYSQVEECI